VIIKNPIKIIKIPKFLLKIDKITKSSLKKFIEGGTPIFKINTKNQKYLITGATENNPLNIKIFRELICS